MGNRISKAIVAGVAALLLAAVATAEPAAAQWSDNGHGFLAGQGHQGLART
jgi:hypothetical protein